MNRRAFCISATASSFLPFLTGCTITPAQVAADGVAISNALIAVGAVYPQAQQQLDQAAAAIVNATKNWQTGNTTADINTALYIAEAVLAAIPQTQAVAALIPIAIAAIDILIASIPASANLSARATERNPYRLPLADQKQLVHHRLGRSLAGDLKAAWNNVAQSNPALAPAVLR